MEAHHEAALKALGATDADIAKMKLFGLPPGTLIGIFTELLPVILKILQGLGTGGTTAPPAA